MGTVDDTGEYCRLVEKYLSQKNHGHLVRIVGPAFERVLAWQARGLPLNVVYRGIDRYVERHEAKGPQRRPARIEFCEADILDVFDEWRKAVGLPASGLPGSGGLPGEDADSGGRKKESLSAHLERVVARLTALRSSSVGVSGFSRTALDPLLDAAVRELDSARASAKGLRGDARQALLDRLRQLDDSLTAAAREACDAATLAALAAEADTELAPFRDRMPADSYDRSRQACVDRLVRERAKLPVIAFE